MKQPNQIILTLVLAVAVLFPYSLIAQDKEMPDLSMTYLKKTDGSVYLEANLSLFIEEENPLPDQYICFFTGIDSLIEIGTMYTDAEGKAGISIPMGFDVPHNEEGYFKYLAVYKGNDLLEMAEIEVEYKDLNLEMRLEEIDSVRTIYLKATELSENGEVIPVPEEDVYVFVSRMFSMLSLAEEWLDDEGEIIIEFPDDLPGDSLGLVTIISMFQDHGIYGNVENRQTIRWGIPSDHSLPESFRGLWTQYAPTWMVVTLSILLAGVWGHYFFVIVKLVQIKRRSRKEKIYEENN
jgi:hypothetical protein